MQPLILDACDHLIEECKQLSKVNSGKVDLMNIIQLYISDAFAQCIFGLEVKSLSDKYLKEFRNHSNSIGTM